MAVKPSASAVCAPSFDVVHAALSTQYASSSFLIFRFLLSTFHACFPRSSPFRVAGSVVNIQAVAIANSWYMQERKEVPAAANVFRAAMGDREECLVSRDGRRATYQVDAKRCESG